jgi:hypothetical protein
MAIRQSVAPVLNKTWVDNALKKIAGSDTTTVTIAPVMHLIGATPPTFSPTVSLADLTAAEAVFSGYGDVTPTLSAPAVVGTNADGVLGEGSYLGHSTTTFTGDTVTGWWWEQGGDWIAGEVWSPDQWVAIGQEGDWLDLSVFLPISFTPALA